MSKNCSDKTRSAYREIFFQETLFVIVALMATFVKWRFHEVIAVVMWFFVIGYPISAIYDVRKARGLSDDVDK